MLSPKLGGGKKKKKGRKRTSGRGNDNKKSPDNNNNKITTTEHNQIDRLTLLPTPYVQRYLDCKVKHLKVRKFLTRSSLSHLAD